MNYQQLVLNGVKFQSTDGYEFVNWYSELHLKFYDRGYYYQEICQKTKFFRLYRISTSFNQHLFQDVNQTSPGSTILLS